MNVLHVIPSISRAHGGPSIAVETMTRALARAGVNAAVATTDDDGGARLQLPLGGAVKRDGVSYFFFRRQSLFYKVSMPLAAWLSSHVRDYDLVHLHGLFSFAALPAAYFAARAGVPYIVRPLGTLDAYGMTQQHALLKRVSFPLIERRMIAGAAYMHYTSAEEQRGAEALGITAPGAVIPIGVESDTEGECQRGEWVARHAPQFAGRVVILFLSRLDPKKGLELLLDAFARVRAQNMNAALIIAGEGNAAYRESLTRRCAELGLDAAVCFAGYVEGNAKRALFCDADIFVLPSSSENFGIAVGEALAAGRAVVVTPQVGIADEIRAAKAGIVVPQDSDRWAAALNRLLLDENERAELGRNAQVLAASKFSLAAMTRGLIEMYEAALGNRKSH